MVTNELKPDEVAVSHYMILLTENTDRMFTFADNAVDHLIAISYCERLRLRLTSPVDSDSDSATPGLDIADSESTN